jgi:hypothetical protein
MARLKREFAIAATRESMADVALEKRTSMVMRR